MARTWKVALRCDAGTAAGRLHVVRSLALAEELVLRGVEAVFVCDTESDEWVRMQLRARGLDVLAPAGTPDDHRELCDEHGMDAVVFDSHTLPVEVYAAVRATGRPTLAVVDGDLRGAEADLVLDPNVGAEEERPRMPRHCSRLAGLDYALLRNDVLANRPVAPPARASAEVPRVLVVLGGGDVPDAPDAPAWILQCLVATGRPFEASVVVAGAHTRAQVESVHTAPRQRIAAIAADGRLAERVVRSDVVLSAAGPLTPELLCLGAAVGLVWVTDDDVETYRRLMVQRAVVGLGSVEALGKDPEVGADPATRLLSDARERSRLAESGWRRVDGLGRARAVDALVALLGRD
jgi:spore coat polysaccharide biosynthesis predicted glycosyltransferase SpsG